MSSDRPCCLIWHFCLVSLTKINVFQSIISQLRWCLQPAFRVLTTDSEGNAADYKTLAQVFRVRKLYIVESEEPFAKKTPLRYLDTLTIRFFNAFEGHLDRSKGGDILRIQRTEVATNLLVERNKYYCSIIKYIGKHSNMAICNFCCNVN